MDAPRNGGSIAGKRAYVLARMSFDEGRFDDARSHLLTLLATHPGDVPGRRMLEAIDTIARRPRPAP